MAMPLSLIKKEAAEIAEINLSELVGAYRCIRESMDEVGGTVVFRAVLPKEGKSFKIDTGDDDDEPTTPKLEGVVIHQHRCNARFSQGTRGEPPLCSSMDAKTGIDWEGETHDCEGCPYNEYGTSGNGKRGKACKNMIRLYLLTEATPVPILLSLPPTSMKAWQTYQSGVLASMKLKPRQVLTELTLTKGQSKSGDEYAKVKPRMLGVLSPDAQKVASMFAEAFAPKVEITEEDYNMKPAEAEE